MSGDHPSVFELDVFVRRGATSVGFESHVSRCQPCAARLSSLARRANPASLQLEAEAPQRRRPQLAVLLTACVAALLVRTVSLVPMPIQIIASEGVHGVASLETSMSPSAGGCDDSGAGDSGMR